MSLTYTASSPGGSTDATCVTSGCVPANHSVDERHLLETINDRKAMLLLPAIIITVLLMLVGLLGNPLALYIYGWRWQNSSTKIFLSCLAVVDLMNCLITMPTEILLMRNFYYFDSDGLCKVSRFTTYIMNNATVVIFLVIAVDRYIRICHPHRKPISPRSAKVACGVGLMMGVAVAWPALILYGRIEIKLPVSWDPPRNITGAMCLVHSDMQGYTLAFFTYLCSAFFVCALILIILYILIGRTILKRKKLQRMRKRATAAALETLGGGAEHDAKDSYRSAVHHHSNGNTSPGLPALTTQTDKLTPDDEATARGCNVNNFSFGKCKKLRPPKATLMLFLITVVYIASFLPFLIISIIRQHRGSAFYPSLSRTEEVMVNIFLRSYLVNNCSNPVVYGLCNSQFRAECKLLYRRIFRKADGTSSSSRQNSRTCQTPRQERRADKQQMTPKQERRMESPNTTPSQERSDRQQVTPGQERRADYMHMTPRQESPLLTPRQDKRLFKTS